VPFSSAPPSRLHCCTPGPTRRRGWIHTTDRVDVRPTTRPRHQRRACVARAAPAGTRRRQHDIAAPLGPAISPLPHLRAQPRPAGQLSTHGLASLTSYCANIARNRRSTRVASCPLVMHDRYQRAQHPRRSFRYIGIWTKNEAVASATRPDFMRCGPPTRQLRLRQHALLLLTTRRSDSRDRRAVIRDVTASDGRNASHSRRRRSGRRALRRAPRHAVSGLLARWWRTDAAERWNQAGVTTAPTPAPTRRPGRSVADAVDDTAAIADAYRATSLPTLGVIGGGPHALLRRLLPELSSPLRHCPGARTTPTGLDFSSPAWAGQHRGVRRPPSRARRRSVSC